MVQLVGRLERLVFIDFPHLDHQQQRVIHESLFAKKLRVKFDELAESIKLVLVKPEKLLVQVFVDLDVVKIFQDF